MGVAQLLKDLHINAADAKHVAEQRALRMALLWEGWSPEEIIALAHHMEPRRLKLDSSALVFMPTFAVLWLDGFAAGVKAQQEDSHGPGS